MKFKITRTSTWFYDNPECEEAFQEEVIIYKGTEHESKVMEWFVNIENLQELIEFINKYEGRAVIIIDRLEPIIEIYDDWRE